MEQQIDQSAYTSDPILSKIIESRSNAKKELEELQSMCTTRGYIVGDELFHQFARTIDAILKLF